VTSARGRAYYERWMRGQHGWRGPAETGVFLARVALADAAR
jgi:hypothetical protein